MKINATPAKRLFSLGQIVCTPGALQALSAERITGAQLLERHEIGDWGDLGESDRQENTLSVAEGFRILSAYTLSRTNAKIWVITEADRSSTTLLLPEEY